MRQLVSIEQIRDIKPIPNADAIEVAQVKGWNVVVKKDQFNVGDYVFYFEVDSWIPKSLAPFLCKLPEKSFNGIVGEKLRTIKLRGQISQGLILPLSIADSRIHEGDTNWADVLGVQKFEVPEAVNGSKGSNFPSYIKKTDQERIQNLDVNLLHGVYQVTEKLDGSSMTIFNNEEYGESGVCSRNIWLDPEDKSHFTQMSNELQILKFLKAHKLSFAIQGELIGPKIQGNPYKLEQNEFYVYNIWDINKQEYWNPKKTKDFCEDLDITHVPIHIDRFYIDEFMTIQEILDYSDGNSNLNSSTKREGLVFKSLTTQDSFKVISNQWLLKNS